MVKSLEMYEILNAAIKFALLSYVILSPAMFAYFSYVIFLHISLILGIITRIL